MSSLDEFFQSVSLEELADTSDIEAEEAQRMHIINTNPEVRSTMLLVHEWLETNHKQPGLDLFSALDVYKDLSKNNKWRAKKLMRLCTMMPVILFTLNPGPHHKISHSEIWKVTENRISELGEVSNLARVGDCSIYLYAS